MMYRWVPLILALAVLGCAENDQLQAFTSDGCSLFPDSSMIDRADWCNCCFEHDVAYWRGGTEDERETADIGLARCVYRSTANELLANIMYEGVRFGGSPYFYNWYRWGYGWSFDRTYGALTGDETALADELLEEYFDGSDSNICPNPIAPPARAE